MDDIGGSKKEELNAECNAKGVYYVFSTIRGRLCYVYWCTYGFFCACIFDCGGFLLYLFELDNGVRGWVIVSSG